MKVPGARSCRGIAEPLGADPEYAQSSVEEDLRKLTQERSVKAGLLSNASRAALTGQPVAERIRHLHRKGTGHCPVGRGIACPAYSLDLVAC